MTEDIEKRLESTDIEERREAVLSLKGLGEGASTGIAEPKDAVKLLTKAMQDVSWRVRKTAVDILLEEYPVDVYIDELIGLLYLEDNAGARNSAIEALAKLSKKATQYLISAFNTKNNDVRKFIIDVLGEFRDKRTLTLMLDALKDEDENVRASAVEHLGSIGDQSVVDALVEILESGDLWTAFPAADALGRIGDKKALPALLNALSRKALREPALKAIGRLGDKDTLKHIIPLINDSSKVVQEESLRAIEMLYRRGVKEDVIAEELKNCFGDGSIEILLNHTRSNKPEVRVSAILFLGILKDERALDPLLDLSLEEEFADDVKKALVFIGKDKPSALVPLFKKDDPYLRRFICMVAAEVASDMYYDIMEGLLGDDDGHVRSIAAAGLSNIGDKSAIGHIIKLFVDRYSDVQSAAVEALSKFRGLLDAEMLIGGLNDKDPAMRKNTALLLGKIKAEGAVPALGFALKDDSVSVRQAVVSALSMIRTEESIKYSIMALTDENPDIRSAAALSLGAIAGEKALEPLCILLNDRDDMVKVSAAKALKLLGNRKAVPNLIRLLSEMNGFVVTTAIESLGHLGGDEARDALIKMLRADDSEIRRTAIKALYNYENIESYILPFIRDYDWATRMAAVETLGHNPKGEVRTELEKLLDTEEDPVVRRAIEGSVR